MKKAPVCPYCKKEITEFVAYCEVTQWTQYVYNAKKGIFELDCINDFDNIVQKTMDCPHCDKSVFKILSEYEILDH